MKTDQYAAAMQAAVDDGNLYGQWEYGSYSNDEIRIGLTSDSKHGYFAVMRGKAAVPWDSTNESKSAFDLAEFISACHPEAIKALLAERAALRAALQMARNEIAGFPSSLGYQYTSLPQIDAALIPGSPA